jgi:hypothetical protein
VRSSWTIAAGGGAILAAAALAYWLPGSRTDLPPELARVVPDIDEHFSDPKNSRFPTLHDEECRTDFRFEAGRYVLQNQRLPGYLIMGPQPEQALEGDIACRVIGCAVAEGKLGWGIDLYTPEDRRHLAIRLLQNGSVEVGAFAHREQAFHPIGSSIRHPAIPSGDQLNALLVLLRGGQRLDIYANGTAITPPIQLAQRLPSHVIPYIISWSGRAEFTRYTRWRLPPAAPSGT